MEHMSYQAEKLQKNDRVTIELDDGKTYEGTVCKSNRGGVRVLSQGGSALYTVTTSGLMKRTHPDGGSLRMDRRVGRVESVTLVGSGSVDYRQREGWVHL